MTLRTDLTYDFSTSPRIITVGSPSTEITIQDLLDTLREREDELNNGVEFKHLINAAGKEDLGGGVSVGITATLQNAKLAFEARDTSPFVQCNILGGNLVAVDTNQVSIDPIQTTDFTQVVKTSSTSASLIATSSPTSSEIADAVWDETMSDHTSSDTTGEQIKKKLLTTSKFLALK